MRDAAKRAGMPQWQSAILLQLASLDEQIQQALAPLRDALESLWDRLKEWLKENRQTALRALYALLVLATLAALLVLLREIKAIDWLLTRCDYLRLGILGRHAAGSEGIRQYYRAMERLFSASDLPRRPAANAREYLREIARYRNQVRSEASEMTGLFEQCRYGQAAVSAAELGRMRHLYRQIFRRID